MTRSYEIARRSETPLAFEDGLKLGDFVDDRTRRMDRIKVRQSSPNGELASPKMCAALGDIIGFRRGPWKRILSCRNPNPTLSTADNVKPMAVGLTSAYISFCCAIGVLSPSAMLTMES